MTFTARNKVAIVGYAQSQIVRHADKPLGAIAIETARSAIGDAGLSVEQVDGFVASSMFPNAGGHAIEDGRSIVTTDWMAQNLGVSPRYSAGFQGYGQLPGSVAMAVNAIASGAAEYVLLHRALHNPKGSYNANPMTSVGGPMQWTAPLGFFGPVSTIGLTYNEYLQRYGAKRESMAHVVVEARKNGARLPWSYWYDKPLTVDEYLDAPLVSDPICRLDCDIPVSGVAAFVLTTAERARDLPHPPVFVAGFAGQSPPTRRLQTHWPLDDMIDLGSGLADRLWSSAGLGPRDVDLPQLYDGFSPFIYFWLETLGFCERGTAHEFVTAGGIDSDSPDGLPILSSGGALGNGRMHGVPQMLECYLQLSRRAGDRQRERASVGLACHASPNLGGVVVYSAEPS
ncbi:MAG TPA: thiolase family protein [Mycobacteriales bacterium]|nr:thiolase family protein [Mycobacteriales bacterium]